MLGVELMFIDWNALLQGSATLYQDAASPAGGADPGALPFTSFIAEYGPWAMIVLLLASGFGV
ncbi:MAG: hypothetical protein VYD99_09480, partial [Planctomycetota bacterium]|nr:hypothetical protein [Planctomycetota bacterium]